MEHTDGLFSKPVAWAQYLKPLGAGSSRRKTARQILYSSRRG